MVAELLKCRAPYGDGVARGKSRAPYGGGVARPLKGRGQNDRETQALKATQAPKVAEPRMAAELPESGAKAEETQAPRWRS